MCRRSDQNTSTVENTNGIIHTDEEDRQSQQNARKNEAH
jgi:hypothetical protein